MDDAEHKRKAAHIIADLLTQSLTAAERDNRHLYVWERDGILWLREQWRRDPETLINMWVGDRYVRNDKLDLFGKVSQSIAS